MSLRRDRRVTGPAVPADANRVSDRDVLRLGNLEWTRPGSPQRIARRRRHRFRPVLRLTGMVMALGLLCGIVITGLLLVVPGVGNATARARALNHAHHVAYPGPAAPRKFSAALAASLTRTFYSGVEPIQVSQEVFGVLTGPSSGSAQTIDQRLASVLYVRGHSGTAAVIERALVGIKLQLAYSRADIVRMYVAVTSFGRGYYGLSSASCGYFGRPPARLSWAQAALLAVAAGAPPAADPLAHMARARAAEAVVLRRLVSAGVLTRAQAGRAYLRPAHLRQAGQRMYRKCHATVAGR